MSYTTSDFTNTPWGEADSVENIAEGIVFVTTPSHGGFWLDAERNAKVPDYMRAASFNAQGERGWYEEDCDSSIVAMVFPEAFPALGATPEAVRKRARDNLYHWSPSIVLRFEAEHA